MCYELDPWRRCRFGEIPLGEDSRFLTDHRRRVYVVPDHRFIVGIIHSRTPARSGQKTRDGIGSLLQEIQRVVGADAPAYLA